MMSADTEVAEIIRRRLFEWGAPSGEREKAAREYADWVAANAGALSGLEAETAHEQFRRSYPFHPSVLSVFERKWQALPRFQRTRGVLRLLALWVARAYREDHRNAYKEPLIGLGTAPIDDPMFRAAMFEQLGTNDLEGPATTDIAGSQMPTRSGSTGKPRPTSRKRGFIRRRRRPFCSSRTAASSRPRRQSAR